jgi:hypothetical protein
VGEVSTNAPTVTRIGVTLADIVTQQLRQPRKEPAMALTQPGGPADFTGLRALFINCMLKR